MPDAKKPDEKSTVDVEALTMKIKQLEAQLSELQAAARPESISADELRAYRKVRSIVGVDECGINECDPLPGTFGSGGYYRRPRIYRCINECTCGPCNIDAIRERLEATKLEIENISTVLRGGAGRFGGLG